MKSLVCMLLFAFILLVTSEAYAFEGVSEYTYQLPAGTTHRGDLAVDAHQAVIDGTVDGDMYVFANTVIVNGHVTGDVISFSANTIISGTVDGNVRSFTENLTISGTVHKSVTAGSHYIQLTESGSVGTNMMLFAANTDLRGRVDREVTGFIDKICITGQIQEGGLLKARSLRLDAPASIGGDFVYYSPTRAAIGPGVTFTGTEIYSPPLDFSKIRHFALIPLLLWGLSSCLCTLLFWLAVRFLFPAGMYTIHRRFDQANRKMFGWGAAAVFGMPILALILLASVVGIPGGLGLIIVFFLLSWGAKVFVGSWLGLTVVSRMKWSLPPMLAELFGVVILQCLLFIPFAGWLLAVPVWIAFLGALAMSVSEKNKAILC